MDPTQVGERPTVIRDGDSGRKQPRGKEKESEGRPRIQLALAATWTWDSLSSRKDQMGHKKPGDSQDTN